MNTGRVFDQNNNDIPISHHTQKQIPDKSKIQMYKSSLYTEHLGQYFYGTELRNYFSTRYKRYIYAIKKRIGKSSVLYCATPPQWLTCGRSYVLTTCHCFWTIKCELILCLANRRFISPSVISFLHKTSMSKSCLFRYSP
jgi:hypothetical protein